MSKSSPKQQYQQLTEWLDTRKKKTSNTNKRKPRFSKADVYNKRR